MAQILDGLHAPRYTNSNLENTYAIEQGAFVIPVAEAAPTSQTELANWKPYVVVQAHAPYRMRKVTYAAKKDGAPPILPSPADSGAFTFLGATIQVPHPKVRPNGEFNWAVGASYMYVEGNASNAQTGLVLGGIFDVFDTPSNNVSVQATGAPASVRESGLGPKAGWYLGQFIDTNNPAWTYSEPTFYPAQLFSDAMISGSPVIPQYTNYSSTAEAGYVAESGTDKPPGTVA